MGDGLAHDLEKRLDLVERRFVAADHDGQRRISRPDVAAADRGVEEGGAFRRQLLREAASG